MKFKEGQTYTTRIGGEYQVISRTAKTITVTGSMLDGEKRVKIHEHDGREIAFPLGRYSMAPVIKAGN